MNKQLNPWLPPLLIVALVGMFLLIGTRKPESFQRDNGFIFGTTYSITYRADSSLHNGIRKQLEAVDASLSMFNKESTLSLINRNERSQSDTLLSEVFTLAQNVSETTGGAFDITVAPLVNVWGFGFKSGEHPIAETIDSLLQITGYQRVWLDGDSICKSDPRIMLDCGAIAKGYGCDMVARYLRSQGINDFMVEIGGEIVVSGRNESDGPWRIGVSKPNDDTLNVSKELQTVLEQTDIAIATSGNYRNFYYKEGKKYAHTIDPRTGYPVQHNILSATVTAKNCATADAYATAFMVVGLEEAKDILASRQDIQAYFILADSIKGNTTWQTPNFNRIRTE